MNSIFVKNITLYLVSICCLVCLLTITQVQANNTHSQHKQHSQHNLMGSHGMVLIYHPEEGFFASHLPLYSTPHNYQIIYQVKLEEPQKYIDMIGKGMVTLLPSNFDLKRLISGESFAINTKIFQGHFERGGEVKFSTDMTFVKPILIEKVSATFTSSKATFYQAVISDQHAIFAHKIQQAPSFDAIGFVKRSKLDVKGETKICEKPSKINEQMIKENIEACANYIISYIETQDFK